MANSECVDKTAPARVARLLQRRHDVGGGFVCHARQARQCSDTKLEQVRWRVHELRVDELVDQLVAKSLDVQRRRPAKCNSACLRWAGQNQAAGAPVNPFVLIALDRRSTNRTTIRHLEPGCLRRPSFRHHRDDLRDHIAGAPDDDRIADSHIKRMYERLVVPMSRCSR